VRQFCRAQLGKRGLLPACRQSNQNAVSWFDNVFSAVFRRRFVI
jgi:hypothetical protein